MAHAFTREKPGGTWHVYCPPEVGCGKEIAGPLPDQKTARNKAKAHDERCPVQAITHDNTGDGEPVNDPEPHARPDDPIEAIRRATERFHQAGAELEAAREARQDAMLDAVEQGRTAQEIADALKLTRQAVNKSIEPARKRREANHDADAGSEQRPSGGVSASGDGGGDVDGEGVGVGSAGGGGASDDS